MGAVTGSKIIERVRERLQDKSNVIQRWSDDLILDALNEGHLALVEIKPDSCSRVEPFDVGGDVYHDLPQGGLSLIKVVRNLGPDGITPGRAVTRTWLEILQAADPNWSMTRDTEVLHYLFDERDTKRFMTYPLVSEGYVELVYSTAPRLLSSAADTLGVDDIHAPALADYTCYRVLNSDMANPANRELAITFYNQFLASVMGKAQGEERVNPNDNRRVS